MPSSLEGGRSSSARCDDFPLAVVTGGSGIIGSALLRRLSPHYRIISIARKPEPTQLQNVSAVSADIRRSGLALDDSVRSLIQSDASLIVHCAADTRFNLGIDESRETNVEGTRHVLDLALQCSSLKQFAHVSTLYIAGRREGLVTEHPIQHDEGYVNTYERAKHEAEAMVLAHSQLLPTGIYRLSSVIQEAGSGGHFRQAIRFVPWCDRFPFFPAEKNVPVDLIAAEWAAGALSELITHHFTPGCIRHICAGPLASLSVGAIMETLFRPPSAGPKLVSAAEFARLPFAGRVGRAVAGLMTFIPHLSITQPFDCTVTTSLLASSGIPRPDMKALLGRVLAAELRS